MHTPSLLLGAYLGGLAVNVVGIALAGHGGILDRAATAGALVAALAWPVSLFWNVVTWCRLVAKGRAL